MKPFLEKEIRKFLIDKLGNTQYSENYECLNQKNEKIIIKNVISSTDGPSQYAIQWVYENTRTLEHLLEEKISIEEPFIVVVSNIHYYLLVHKFLDSNDFFKNQGICYLIDDKKLLQEAWNTRFWYFIRLVDHFFTQTDFGKISMRVDG